MASPRNPLVCTCLTVRHDEIVSAIRAGARSVAEVGKSCEAGTGCHTCHPAILLLLEEEVHRALAAGRAPEPLQQLGLFDPSGAAKGPGGAARKPGQRGATTGNDAKIKHHPDSAE